MRTILKTELKTLAVNFYLCCISLQWKAVKHLHNKICFSKLNSKMASFELGSETKNTFYLSRVWDKEKAARLMV